MIIRWILGRHLYVGAHDCPRSHVGAHRSSYVGVRSAHIAPHCNEVARPSRSHAGISFFDFFLLTAAQQEESHTKEPAEKRSFHLYLLGRKASLYTRCNLLPSHISH